MQHIMVFQQNGRGESKILGIRKYGNGIISIHTTDIDGPLSTLIDDTRSYLPDIIEADMVLDFLKHPDLSHDLAQLCQNLDIPIVASGKKWHGKGIFTPPT